jgi:hypothetical protein
VRRKIRDNEPNIIDDVFAYRPPSSRGGMMKSGAEPEGEEILEDSPMEEAALRALIRHEVSKLRA